MAEATLAVAFIAGLVSFLSPCILPLVPAYLTFLAGTTIKGATEASFSKTRGKIFLSSVFFVLGFSVVFSLLGVLLQSALSSVAYDARQYLSYIGGAIIILFGLMLLGILRLDFLQRDYKLNLKLPGGSYLSSFAFGASFAVGWTPCVGAVFGATLTLAATQPAAAFPLMLTYSLGLGLPFLIAGLFFSSSSRLIRAMAPYMDKLNLVFGLVLVLLGILVMTNSLYLVSNFFPVEQLLGAT